METSAELIALIHQIRNATSPLHRLKLVALAWRTLRGLAPVDRLAVAKAIGVEGAERLVEQLGSHGGVSPALLLGAIQRAEKAEPAELERLLTELKDPAERAELISEAAAELERWVVPDVAAADPAAATPATSLPVPPEPAVPATSTAPPIPTPPVPQPAPPPAATATSPPATVTPAPPAAAAAPPRPQPRRRPPSPPPSAPRRAAPAAKPARRPDRVRPEPGDHREDRRATTGRAPHSSSRERSDLATRLREADGTFRRLRLLTACASDAVGLKPQDLAALVDSFQPGWPRRRALETLVRAGAITDPETLLDLLADTDSRTTQWALSAYVARSELSSGDLGKLEAADPGHPIGRRLAYRRARRRRQAARTA